jgi:hypothetical protein
MAIRIENIQVDGQNDKRIILSNAGIARKLDIGNDWNRLRIGLRLAFVDVGDNIGAGHELWIGTMSNPDTGLTNGPLGINCSHFVGFRSRDTNDWSLHSSSDPTRYYWNSTTDSMTSGRKIGNTFIIQGNLGPIRISCTPSLNRTIVIFELVRSGSNMNGYYLVPGGATAAVRDYSKEELIAAMEIDGPTSTSLRNYLGLLSGTTTNYYAAGPLGVATSVDEITNGPLNSIVVAWNRTITPLIISEVLWAKMS